MILKINRKDEPNLFNDISEAITENTQFDHRRNSNFWTQSIVKFEPEYAKYYPELNKDFSEYVGTWETNTYLSDPEHGTNWSEITELTRVEQIIKVVETKVWAPVTE